MWDLRREAREGVEARDGVRSMLVVGGRAGSWATNWLREGGENGPCLW